MIHSILSINGKMCTAVPPQAQPRQAAASAAPSSCPLQFGAALGSLHVQAPPGQRQAPVHKPTCPALPSPHSCSAPAFQGGPRDWKPSEHPARDERRGTPGARTTGPTLLVPGPSPQPHRLCAHSHDLRMPSTQPLLPACSACTWQAGDLKELTPAGNSFQSMADKSWWINIHF